MQPDLDEHGNERCTGIGSADTWQWRVVRQGKPIDGERYGSPQNPIYSIPFAPQQDGARVCALELGYDGSHAEDDSPVSFTISTRPGVDQLS